MDLLIVIRLLGLLAATGIGLFRLKVNFLRRHERYIYILATITTAWFFVAALITELRTVLNLSSDFTHHLWRMGWPFMLTTLILFMLYYRRFPKY